MIHIPEIRFEVWLQDCTSLNVLANYPSGVVVGLVVYGIVYKCVVIQTIIKYCTIVICKVWKDKGLID